jgi:ATP-dependent DNA helicase Q4
LQAPKSKIKKAQKSVDKENESTKKPKTKAKNNKKENKVESASDDDDADANEEKVDPTQLKSPQPLYELDSEGYVPAHLPKSAFKMLKNDFGYSSFKPHQEEAIVRIACGLSTIVVLSTGYGKSLIYQFAAKLYARTYPGSLCLVVSPLISLMQDQLHNLSGCLRAAVCDSQMNDKEYQQLLVDLGKGKINILFMSPEAIINRKIKELPRLAFVCIDEVHCLSQWSHNFRPSYLQLGQVKKRNFLLF